MQDTQIQALRIPLQKNFMRSSTLGLSLLTSMELIATTGPENEFLDVLGG